MAEELNVNLLGSKEEKYIEIVPQIEAIVSGESDLTANLANVCGVLNTAFGHLWTGFYIRRGSQLVLGPFQGPLACTWIPLSPYARGVCGASAVQRLTLVVPDVEAFPEHIACSSLAKSEIVVPLVIHGHTELVLDVDSVELGAFDYTDQVYLERVIEVIKIQHFINGTEEAAA